MSYLNLPHLERASVPQSPEEYDNALRVRLRSAPAAFKAAVDRDRVGRGLDPLWSTRAACRRPQPTRRLASVLAGVAAPYVSHPVAVPNASGAMREFFDPACCRSMLDRVKQGRHVRLLDGHGGVPLATTADGSLKLDVDPRLGLTLVAELADTLAARRLVETYKKSGVPLSAGFVILRSEPRRLLGREVVAVVEAALDHIAVVGRGHRPAYPGANAVFAASANPADVRAASEAAKRTAFLRLGSLAY